MTAERRTVEELTQAWQETMEREHGSATISHFSLVDWELERDHAYSIAAVNPVYYSGWSEYALWLQSAISTLVPPRPAEPLDENDRALDALY